MTNFQVLTKHPPLRIDYIRPPDLFICRADWQPRNQIFKSIRSRVSGALSLQTICTK